MGFNSGFKGLTKLDYISEWYVSLKKANVMASGKQICSKFEPMN